MDIFVIKTMKYLRDRLSILKMEKTKTTFKHRIDKIDNEIDVINNLIEDYEDSTCEINSGIDLYAPKFKG